MDNFDLKQLSFCKAFDKSQSSNNSANKQIMVEKGARHLCKCPVNRETLLVHHFVSPSKIDAKADCRRRESVSYLQDALFIEAKDTIIMRGK